MEGISFLAKARARTTTSHTCPCLFVQDREQNQPGGSVSYCWKFWVLVLLGICLAVTQFLAAFHCLPVIRYDVPDLLLEDLRQTQSYSVHLNCIYRERNEILLYLSIIITNINILDISKRHIAKQTFTRLFGQ